jgi:hypothetical protein
LLAPHTVCGEASGLRNISCTDVLRQLQGLSEDHDDNWI